MNNSTENIDLIERYFDNAMTEEEKLTFMDRLKSDLELRHLFDRERLLINTIRFGAAKDHLNFFKDLEKSLPDITAERKISPYIYYAAAASVVILVVAGIYFFSGNERTETQLYAENFVPYPNVFEPTVRGSEEATKRALAFQKYEHGDYQQAADLFSEILVDQRDQGMVLLLGNAQLALGKIDDAKDNFSKVIEGSPEIKDSPELAAPAHWYLGLCFVKNGETQNAIETFEKLTKVDNPYAQRAKDLLKQLKQ
jgi:tetratricopeptide (TPR) repeat protein